jgi:hypothetical protein
MFYDLLWSRAPSYFSYVLKGKAYWVFTAHIFKEQSLESVSFFPTLSGISFDDSAVSALSCSFPFILKLSYVRLSSYLECGL